MLCKASNKLFAYYKHNVYIWGMSGLTKAIDYFGSQTLMAEKLGLRSSMAISQWKKRGVPIKRAIQIEELTKGAITRQQLCPDFPWEPVAA